MEGSPVPAASRSREQSARRARVTDYRTVRGSTALIRRVAVGNKGRITFLIRVNLTTGSAPWNITSATMAYKGLNGHGKQVVDKYYETPATFVMKGTVSR